MAKAKKTENNQIETLTGTIKNQTESIKKLNGLIKELAFFVLALYIFVVGINMYILVASGGAIKIVNLFSAITSYFYFLYTSAASGDKLLFWGGLFGVPLGFLCKRLFQRKN